MSGTIQLGKKNKESFKVNTKFVDMLKIERKNISKSNKIFPLYLVYNDRTLEDIIEKKPVTKESLLSIKGMNKEKYNKFGIYLLNKIREFLGHEIINAPKKEDTVFQTFLKEIRRIIGEYNKISPIYNVFNNKTLDDIISKEPETKEELLAVYGIGERNYNIWGDYLLKELIKYYKK